MKAFFGESHDLVKDKVQLAWAKGAALASAYQTPWGQSKFVGIMAQSENLRAYVLRQDFHGRIAINLNKFSEQGLPLVLGHEISHLSRVNRFTQTGAGTYDHYYLFPSKLTDLVGLAGPKPPTALAHLQVANSIVQGHLNSTNLAAPLHENFITGVRLKSSTPDAITDIDTALAAHNTHSGLAAAMAAENAGSVIHSAFYAHNQYKQLLAQRSTQRTLAR